MPPQTRLIPASAWASESFLNECTAPGRPSEPTENSMSSLPKKSAIVLAAAAENVLCPEVYEGKDGDARFGTKSGLLTMSGLSLGSCSRIAVSGRQKL